MSREYRILPECDGDTLMIDIIGFKNPDHQYGITEVAKAMMGKRKTQLTIRVVDNDNRLPKYFDEFDLIEKKDSLILKKHPINKHHLIFLDPAFEQWVLNAAEEVGVDAAKYGFKNLKSFLRVTKSSTVHKNQNVKQFLNAIKQKKNSPMTTIKNWIDDILK